MKNQAEKGGDRTGLYNSQSFVSENGQMENSVTNIMEQSNHKPTPYTSINPFSSNEKTIKYDLSNLKQ